MKKTALATLMIAFLCGPLHAASIDISKTLTVHFDIPGGWVSNQDPPQFLVDDMAEHVKHDAELKGQHPSKEQVQQIARKRFADNEALLFNPKSHAFMSLDFSRLRQGEHPPSHNSIKMSATYAGESLSGEEGVTDATIKISDTEIMGAWYAQRFDASYKHHEQPMVFTGIVGFVSPYWFYFYFTDYLADQQDRKAAETILKSIRIESR